MIYTHVLNRGGLSVRSPLDRWEVSVVRWSLEVERVYARTLRNDPRASADVGPSFRMVDMFMRAAVAMIAAVRR